MAVWLALTAALPWAYLDCPTDQQLPRNYAPRASWCVMVNEAREAFSDGDPAKAYLLLKDAEAKGDCRPEAGELALPLAEAACKGGATFIGKDHFRLAECLMAYPAGSLAGLDGEAAREEFGRKRVPDDDCVTLRSYGSEAADAPAPKDLPDPLKSERERVAKLCYAEPRNYLSLDDLEPFMGNE